MMWLRARPPLLALLALAALAGALVLGRSEARGEPAPQTPHLASSSAGVVAGEVVVVYEEGGDPLFARSAVDELGARTVERIPSLRADLIELPAGLHVEDAVARLAGLPGVAYAEPNIKLHGSQTPNDPNFADQKWYMDLIGAPAAWDRQTGDGGIIVAVIDTGADLRHEDIAPRLWTNTGEVPNDGLDNDRNGCVDDLNGCNFLTLTTGRAATCGYALEPPHNQIADDAGHGTEVTGVLGAAGNNGRGITGAAWNARLMIVKAMDCSQSGTGFDVAKAIDYAVANGARIINLSLGGPNPSNVLIDAIDRASRSGVLLFAAGGNFETGAVDFPARMPNVVAVGASGGQAAPDARAAFSNWGPEIDVVAPGEGVITTMSGGGYRGASGTSFSTPLVAGVATLLLSQNATLTLDDVLKILRSSSKDLFDGETPNWDGAGRVRADRALDRVPSTIRGALRVNGGPAAGAMVEGLVGGRRCGAGTAVAGADGSSRYEFRVNPSVVEPGCGAPGAKISIVVDGVAVGVEVEWKGRVEKVDLDVNLPPQSTFDLQPGWNLVALPLDPPTASLTDILGPVVGGLDTAVVFDQGAQQFRFFVPNDQQATAFSEWRPGQGIWLRLRAPARLSLRGTRLFPGLPLLLVKGFNLVGVTVPGPAPVKDALRSIDGKYSAVFGFTGGLDGRFLVHLPGGSPGDNTLKLIEPGKGYWIIMDTDAVLIPPVTTGSTAPAVPMAPTAPTNPFGGPGPS